MLDPNVVTIPERFRNHPLFSAPVAGMNVGFMARRGYYRREEVLSQPEIMKAGGVNWVTLNMNFCQDAFYSRKLYLDFRFSTGELELYDLVKRFHDCGIHVLFKPCLTPLDGMWMGSVAFPHGKQIAELDVDYWKEWFASFTQAETYFARLAKTVGMDAMLIGAEYFGTEGRGEEWRRIIDRVRAEYDGPISYEFMYSSRKAYPLDWFEGLDFLSYSYYPPAAPPNGVLNDWDSGDPEDQSEGHAACPRVSPHYTREQMEEYLSSRKEKIAGISAAYGHKPIVFTELGVRSAHGCVMQPGNYQWETSYDGQEQADYMEACMNTFWQLPCWMGLFWWKWDETQYRPHYHDEPGVDKGFTVRGKPAERVMADWFRKLNAGR